MAKIRLVLSGVFLFVPFGFAQPRGPVSVAVDPVVEQELPATLRLVGTVRPDKTSTIAAEVEGVIRELHVEEGTFLKQGDIIVILDDANARYRLEEAEARLASLQAELDELVNGTRREELDRWRAAVEEAAAIRDKWEYERLRVEDLYKRGQTNQKEYHDAQMEHQAAVRRHAQLAAQLEEAVNGARPEAVLRARANLAAQQSMVNRLRRDVTMTCVRAPFDGFVTRKRTEIGQWIDAGGPVCEMIAVETVRVRVDVPASAFAYCRTGALASVEIEQPRASYEAEITRVIPQADPSARTFPIEIDLSNANHVLLPGMFVWAYVPAGAPGKRLLVNKDAIVQRGQLKQIFVVRGGDGAQPTAYPLNVTTGMEMRGMVEVQAIGLRAGEMVVCRGNEHLFMPTPVIPMSLPDPSATTQPVEAGAPVPSQIESREESRQASAAGQ